MRDALVFNGASNLEFQDIRTNVVRIPEVIIRIREAQVIWDKVSTVSLDLANFIGSEDAVFLSHIKLKSFATAVVQVGLLDRYLKSHKMPEYVIGAINGDSPMRVAMGLISFEQMVTESLAASQARPKVPVANALDLPILAGVQLVEHAVYRLSVEAGGYVRMTSECSEVDRMMINLVDEHDVTRLVMVGPGSSVSGKRVLDLTARDVQVLESIDLDPMLSWFWSNLRESRLAIAN